MIQQLGIYTCLNANLEEGWIYGALNQKKKKKKTSDES